MNENIKKYGKIFIKKLTNILLKIIN